MRELLSKFSQVCGFTLFLVIFATGCGKGGSAKNKKLCKQAGDKYSTCIKEKTGMDVAPNQGNIDACAKDDKTLAMYKECMPKSGCEAFLECIDDYVKKTAP